MGFSEGVDLYYLELNKHLTHPAPRGILPSFSASLFIFTAIGNECEP